MWAFIAAIVLFVGGTCFGAVMALAFCALVSESAGNDAIANEREW